MLKWQILYVEDDPQISDQLKTFFEDDVDPDASAKFEVTIACNFDSALDEIKKRRFDILILDVINDRDGSRDEEAGRRVFEQIKSSWFIPVVFYTGVPETVNHLNTPMVRVVPKDDGVTIVYDMVIDLIRTGIPHVNRGLLEQIEHMQRDYMWDFVAKHWNEYGGVKNSEELSYLLTRRLSITLASQGINQLSARQNQILEETEIDEEQFNEGISPLQYYVIPPVVEKTVYGDLFKDPQGQFVIILTPTCDFFQENDRYILVAKCIPLTHHNEYKIWAESNKGRKFKENFEKLLTNRRRENYYFLPSFLHYPDLLVDLQQLISIDKTDFENYTRIASLDNVFAAELNSRFLRYYGRYGTPDLNVRELYDRLLREHEKNTNTIATT